MTPEEAEQLQAENDALRAEIKLLTECRETQTHNWRADQFEKSRMNRRIGELQARADKLQSMYDHSQEYIAKLEYQQSAKGQAEQLFKGAAQ